MSQSELAARSGVAQSNIAAYEAGRRRLSEAMLDRLLRAIAPRPSEALERHRGQIARIVARYPVAHVRVFGSVARGEDDRDSDVDILVDPEPGATIFDLTALALELEALLGVRVDVVSSRGLKEHHHRLLDEAVLL